MEKSNSNGTRKEAAGEERPTRQKESLRRHFEREIEMWEEDRHFNLDEAEQKWVKEGKYKRLAAEKIGTLKRRIFYQKASSAISAGLLGLGAMITVLSGTEVGAAWTLDSLSFPFFFAFTLGTVAIIGTWRIATLEKQLQICRILAAPGEQEEKQPS
jgi:hypothetical protein